MNKSTLSKFLWFTAGASIGSAVTWKFLKTKYERIAQEEIDSVKAVYSRLKSEDEPNEIDIPKEAPSIKADIVTGGVSELKAYDGVLQKQNYVDYSNNKKEEEGGPASVDVDKPYQISPDEFGEFDDYESVYLNYFADGVLADDDYDAVDDVGEIVGFDFFKYFGTYEDDCVWIRNDKLKCDYEICADRRNYTDVV